MKKKPLCPADISLKRERREMRGER